MSPSDPTPWTIRNLLVLGSPVRGRSNLGLELYASNHDCAAAAVAEMIKSGCHAQPLDRASWPIWLVTLLGFAGLARCDVSNRLAAVLLGGLLLVYPLAYYPEQHIPRYRYPILWVSSLLAAYALTTAWKSRQSR